MVSFCLRFHFSDNERLYLASFQFNTLDIIANQETFMELVGFVNRTFCSRDDSSSGKNPPSSVGSFRAGSGDVRENTRRSSFAAGRDAVDDASSAPHLTSSTPARNAMTATTPSPVEESFRLELTAEFHRLNVLLMRIDKSAVSRSSATGKAPESSFMSMDYPRQEAHKVATLTLAQAKIQASYAQENSGVEGSLGGLNLCDLTPACGR